MKLERELSSPQDMMASCLITTFLMKNNNEPPNLEAEKTNSPETAEITIKEEVPEEVVPEETVVELPPDWKAATAPDGKTYYYNEVTHETTWSVPTATTSHVRPSPSKIAPLRVESIDSRSHSSSSLDDPGTATPPRTFAKRGSISSRFSTGSGSTSSLHSSTEKLGGRPGSPTSRKKKVRQNQKPPFLHYPKSGQLAEQRLLDTNKVSYCDNFWEDSGEVPGVDIVRRHVDKGRDMLKEMAEFFRERAVVEEIYARNLERVSKMTLADNEGGTLGKAWRHLRRGLEEEAAARMKFSQQMTLDLERHMMEYADGNIAQKKELKKFDQMIADDRKQVAKLHTKMEEQRTSLTERQTKSQGAAAKDAAKAKKKMAAAGEEYKKSIANYNQGQRKWVEDMILGLMEYEKTEEQRINFAKKQLFGYLSYCRTAESAQSRSFSDIDSLVSAVDPNKDAADFVKRRGTGEVRPIDVNL